jgi:2-succinyl-6-hydroxy-2,4-cyclohexadiene-1-carboxylate synthase
MLHGFGGTGRAYDRVIEALPRERYTPLALDLPGHGENADAALPVTYDRCVQMVLTESPARFTLCGYSMGGRIALKVALAAPQRVNRLVLVSATAGIEDEDERRARAERDKQLASEIESHPLEWFIERWRTQPMFAAEPQDVRALASEDHRRSAPAGLAAALRGIGSGAMEPLWGRLAKLPMPVVVLAGERDRKYQALGQRIAAAVPDGSLRIVSGGHGLLLENPLAVAGAIAGEGATRRPIALLCARSSEKANSSNRTR